MESKIKIEASAWAKISLWRAQAMAWLLIALAFPLVAQADEAGLCPRVDVVKNAQLPERYSLMQFGFDDAGKAVSDLAIIIHNINLPAQIKRVTFDRDVSTGCYFKPLALEAGGDWGWHVLWQSAKGLFYARVDGEAWVSSIPKILSKSAIKSPQLSLNGQTLVVTWQEYKNDTNANMQAVSNDEGRSWEIAPASQ